MINYYSILKSRSVPVHNFLEIGSRDGRDAQIFADAAGIGEVFVVEPAPQSYADIVRRYPDFKVFNCALSNRDGRATFHNIVESDMIKRGMSSLMARGTVYEQLKTDTIDVQAMKGSTFLELNAIDTVSACKIDVEGHSFEVLEGFGKELTRIKSMHVECEVVPVWDGQKLYREIRPLLESRGYLLVYYREYNQPTTQCDSIWIHSSAL
jgi:FkbM family methyltransferase